MDVTNGKTNALLVLVFLWQLLSIKKIVKALFLNSRLNPLFCMSARLRVNTTDFCPLLIHQTVMKKKMCAIIFHVQAKLDWLVISILLTFITLANNYKK